MCGICGIIDFQAQAPDRAHRLQAMMDTLQHRGPDQSGTWLCPQAALGHLRLSIIDLSDGRQPLSNEDGTVWITFNGEIYNFQPMREELIARGHTFKTHTDTEVIVHLYEDEGIEGMQRLEGMFAIGLWDTNKQCFYLIRDPLGIKPIYYTILNGRLIFGSEIKAILAHGGMPRAIREDAFWDYMTFLYVPSPKTMFRNIFKLPAGHWLRFDATGLSQQQYWDLPPQQPLDMPRAAMEEELIAKLQSSVQGCLMSDVPLGAFLSGGVDSSSVVAMMARIGQRPLITTSIGFEEKAYDELAHARNVAQRYGTTHHEEIVRAEAASIVEKLAWHYDEPLADYSAIPTFYVSQLARKHVTVALSGDGGDENFGGYLRYQHHLAERRRRALLPPWVRQALLGPLAALYPNPLWLPQRLRARSTFQQCLRDDAAAYTQRIGILNEEHKREFFSRDVVRLLGGYDSVDIIRGFMDQAGRTGLDRLMYTDIKTYLPDDILTKVDRASMAVSLEVRVPLLNHSFVEYASRVPAALKIDEREGKAIFKSALRPYLDDATLYRHKQGFTPPIGQWLRGPLRDMAADLLLGPHPAHHALLQDKVIRKVWDAHQRGAYDYSSVIWAVLMFELWADKHLNA